MAFRIRKPSQESFFALNAIPLYSYAIPLPHEGGGDPLRPSNSLTRSTRRVHPPLWGRSSDICRSARCFG